MDSPVPPTAELTTVRLRFFASARAAAGTAELSLSLPPGSTIADALDRVSAAPGEKLDRVSAAPEEKLDRVLARCSFLVNAIATTDRATVLGAGDLIDVLPPFAGG